MSRCRVLLLARELNLGGTERQLTEIARALDRDEFEPHVGCFRPEGIRGEELRVAGVPVVRFPVESFRSFSVVAAARSMGAYLRKHSIDLVHTFDVPMNLFGVPVARAYKAPRVVSSQRAHRDLTPGVRRRLLRATDRLVDALVVNSDSVRRQLIEQDRVPPGKIHLCRNGIDTSVFRRKAGPRPAAVEDARLTIGTVCALRPEKDLPTLLSAFERVKDLKPGMRLVFVGSGPVEGQLRAQAASLGIAGQCHFEPATTRVAEWLRAMDIFVLPSLSEALSNSLMEAMACGCCVAASRVGGNPELVSDGQTGLLFQPAEPMDLAEALRFAIQNDDAREAMARQAALRIEREFTLQAAARRMGEIYRALLDGGAAHRDVPEHTNAAA